VLASGQPQLVLLVGPPSIGKGHLLRAVRARAERAGRVVLPAQPTDTTAPWLVIDKSTAIGKFSEAATVPAPKSGFEIKRPQKPPGASGGYPVLTPADPARRPPGGQPAVVLIYGYWPDEVFGQWFTAEFAGQRAESVPRMTIIITATSADAEPLLRHPGLVDRVVDIAPLPPQTMLSELHAIDDQVSDKLTERELDLYAGALAREPSLLDAFLRLLPLTAEADDEAT
jgi:hypothetical protein